MRRPPAVEPRQRDNRHLHVLPREGQPDVVLRRHDRQQLQENPQPIQQQVLDGAERLQGKIRQGHPVPLQRWRQRAVAPGTGLPATALRAIGLKWPPQPRLVHVAQPQFRHVPDRPERPDIQQRTAHAVPVRGLAEQLRLDLVLLNPA